VTYQIGTVLSGDYFPIQNIISMASLLDDLGYSQVSVPEIWGHDAITLLTALSQKTSKIRLATGIISMFSRSPALTAMTAASLDEISGGRFILGLGLSGPKVIENLHGLEFTKPLTRTREFVDIVRTLLKKERLDHSTTQLGELKDFRLSIRSINENIPIHIASLGPKNIELTCEIADGWIPVIMPISEFKSLVETLQRNLKLNGKDANAFAITPFVPTIIGDSPDEINLLKAHLGYYFGGMGAGKGKNYYNNMLKRAGFEEEADEIIEKYMVGDIVGGINAITDEILDAVCVYGSKDQAIEKLIQIIKAGATCPLLTLPFKSKLDHVSRTLQALAPVNVSM
jgi:F420-dependent oxidoreductase-like protein